MQVIDKVKFIMPVDRELQFAAMSILQAYVNGYDNKMLVNDTSPNKDAKYILRYNCDMCSCDWEFFQQIGLKLTYDRGQLDGLDMLVDFSWPRVEGYLHGRHLAEVYGSLVGVESRPLPDIRRIKPRGVMPFRWIAMNDILDLTYNTNRNDSHTSIECYSSDQDLICLQDYECTGFIGRAGYETYLAASMGLPVIEIIPDDRQIGFLSKFTNRGYRVIVDCNPREMKRLVSGAVKNLEILCANIAAAEAAGKAASV